MADPETTSWGVKIVHLLWKNRKVISTTLRKIRSWITKTSGGRVVILGPGGTGKDTLAKVLTSDGIPITLDLAKYNESSDVESYTLKPKKGAPVEVVVLPGQKHRRESTWPEFLQKVSAGQIRGVILVTSFGYHSIAKINIRTLKQWTGRKDRFLKAYLADRQAEVSRGAQNRPLGGALLRIQNRPF